MTRQRGQSVVEFALVIPMFALLLFALIYGGIMFLQYFNISQLARAEARRVAVMDTPDLNSYFKVETSSGQTANYPSSEAEAIPVPFKEEVKLGRFYNVNPKIWVEKGDVVIVVELERNNNDLPSVLKWVGWPPEKLKSMEYRMKLERRGE